MASSDRNKAGTKLSLIEPRSPSMMFAQQESCRARFIAFFSIECPDNMLIAL